MSSQDEKLKSMLNPSSIAIIGASGDPKKLSAQLLSHMLRHGYKGSIFPVNKKEDNIQGLTCYPSIKEIPEIIDLAILMVPANIIPEILQECVENGVKSAIIGTSGFAETGEDGIKLQQKIGEIAKKGGLRFCGPNSIGLCNFIEDIYASFSMALNFPEVVKGNISFVTQSGAMGGSMLSRGWEKGIGFSRFISTGNEANIETPEYIDFLVDDSHTKVIAVFLEGLNESNKFKNAARKALKAKKPIVIFKNGKTSVGQRSVKSHTGVLAGSQEVYEAFFNQYGIVHVEDISELFNVSRVFATQPLPQGKRVGIVSTSGGGCSILADLCIKQSLEVPEFLPKTADELSKIIPEYGASNNPVDTTAQVAVYQEMYKKVLQQVLNDDSIDIVIMMLTTVAEPAASIMANGIVEICKEAEKPVVVTWTIAEALASEGMHILQDNQIPLYERPESAVNAISKLIWYRSKCGA